MGSTDQVHIVLLQEVGNDVSSEDKTDSSLVLAPPRHSLLRVGPEQVAEKPLVWDFYGPDDFQNLLEIVQLWTDSSVHTQNLLIDDGAYWHDVENV